MPAPRPAPAVRPAQSPVIGPLERPTPPQKPAARTPERPDNSAECARILQRMSLGESGADMIERLKTLGCR